MSYHITRFVLSLKGLTPSEKAVLHCLAYYAHEDGSDARPSMTRVAEESGLSSRQSAQRIVKRMENRGILIAKQPSGQGRLFRKGGRSRTVNYRFNLEYCIPPDALSKDGNCIPGATKLHPPGCTNHKEPTARYDTASQAKQACVPSRPRPNPRKAAETAYKLFCREMGKEDAFKLVLWIVYRAANPEIEAPQIPQSVKYYKTAWRNFDRQYEYGQDSLLDFSWDRFDKYARNFVASKAPELLEWLEATSESLVAASAAA